MGTGAVRCRMDDSVLQDRLDAIAWRQRLILRLLVAGYALAGVAVVVERVDAITWWSPAVGLVVLAVVAAIAGIYRRRRARE